MPEWVSGSYNLSIETVTFAPSFADARPTTTAKWFVNMQNLTMINGLEYLNTSEVENMMYMFMGCQSLTALDLSSFNTANVMNMLGMFADCRELTSLDISSFNTAEVADMRWMFNYCIKLPTLDISSFSTANVSYTFQMFSGCMALTTIYAGSGWTMDGVDKTNQNYYTDMFAGDEMLVGGKGTEHGPSSSLTEEDIDYACIDGGTSAPGYFTAKIVGDVNGDGTVTIADVTSLVNIILGKATAPASGVADVNGDHAVTIADVTSLVNIILGKH